MDAKAGSAVPAVIAETSTSAAATLGPTFLLFFRDIKPLLPFQLT
ncbi:hypothetical protein [Streptosporangium sp. H16]